MNARTIIEWIKTGGWPKQLNENIAIKYFFHDEKSSRSTRILTHGEISFLSNQVNQSSPIELFAIISNIFIDLSKNHRYENS